MKRYLLILILFFSCSKSSDDSGYDNYNSTSSNNSSSTIQNSNTSSSTNNSSSASTSSSSTSSSGSSSGSSSTAALTELPSGTFVFNVSAENSNDYRVSVTDSNSDQFGFDPTIKVKVGDDLTFNVDSPGHPFYLKSASGTGTDNQLSDVNNNGSEKGTITWKVPADSSGSTFYYLCSVHGAMQGSIIVE